MHEKCDRIVHTAAPRESNFDIVESCTVNIGRKSRELLHLRVCTVFDEKVVGIALISMTVQHFVIRQVSKWQVSILHASIAADC